MPNTFDSSRRRFLQQTFAFSALAAFPAGHALAQSAPAPDTNAQHIFAIGDWGTDKYIDQQVAVSRSMQTWYQRNNCKPSAMFLLGDNWYGDMDGGLDCPRWKAQFEDMYPAADFPGPAFAVLGNHDYEKKHVDKVDLQLQYPRTRKTRWTMPDTHYTFKFPEQNPIITFICLDSNYPGTKNAFDMFGGSYLMHHRDAAAQDEWFAAELAKPRTTPFLAVICHHPLYTNGIHRDNPILISRWDKLLRDHHVDFFLTGHDHDLQHIEFAGHPTSFIISGGGGAELVDWTTPPEKRGPWGGRVLGFSHLELTPQAVTLRHIGKDAIQLHAFRKYPGGKMEILTSV